MPREREARVLRKCQKGGGSRRFMRGGNTQIDDRTDELRAMEGRGWLKVDWEHSTYKGQVMDRASITWKGRMALNAYDRCKHSDAARAKRRRAKEERRVRQNPNTRVTLYRIAKARHGCKKYRESPENDRRLRLLHAAGLVVAKERARVIRDKDKRVKAWLWFVVIRREGRNEVKEKGVNAGVWAYYDGTSKVGGYSS